MGVRHEVDVLSKRRSMVRLARWYRECGWPYKRIAMELGVSLSWAHVLAARGGEPWRSVKKEAEKDGERR